MKSLSRVRLLATPWTAAYQAPPSMGFSRQEYWSGVPLPSPLWSWSDPSQGNGTCRSRSKPSLRSAFPEYQLPAGDSSGETIRQIAGLKEKGCMSHLCPYPAPSGKELSFSFSIFLSIYCCSRTEPILHRPRGKMYNKQKRIKIPLEKK